MNHKLELILSNESSWYSGREKDLEYEMMLLKRQGLDLPNQVIIKFLKEFLDVQIEHKLDSGFIVELSFNVENGLSMFDYSEIKPFEDRIKPKLCIRHNLPIGSTKTKFCRG